MANKTDIKQLLADFYLAASNSLRFSLAKMIWESQKLKTWALVPVPPRFHYGTLSVLPHRIKVYHLHLEVPRGSTRREDKGLCNLQTLLEMLAVLGAPAVPGI